MKKNTIKWLERKIGKHDTNLLIFFIAQVGVITGVFFALLFNTWILLFYSSMFFVGCAFGRASKM